MTTLRAWVGRANRQRLQLLQDGVAVADGAVTRAVLKFGDYCLDTDEAGDPIELVDDATVVELQLGLVSGIAPMTATGRLTVYDNVHTQGIAWQEVLIDIGTWAVCE
jgi:hypothetical protein